MWAVTVRRSGRIWLVTASRAFAGGSRRTHLTVSRRMWPRDCRMSRALRSEPEATRREVSFEDRFENQLRGRHRHPVPDPGDAKQLELVRLARLGYMHPPQRLRPICLGPQFVGEFVEERSHTGDPLSGDDIYRDAIDTRGPGIGSHVDPSPPQDIAAGDLVVEGMEPACGVLLGTAIQHALEGSNRVHAIGVPDVPSAVSTNVGGCGASTI